VKYDCESISSSNSPKRCVLNCLKGGTVCTKPVRCHCIFRSMQM